MVDAQRIASQLVGQRWGHGMADDEEASPDGGEAVGDDGTRWCVSLHGKLRVPSGQ